MVQDMELRDMWLNIKSKEEIYLEISDNIDSTRYGHRKFNEVYPWAEFTNRDNIGIQLNNKIGEMNHLFREAGLDFFNDSVLSVPILYSLTVINQGRIDFLKASSPEINKVGSRLFRKKMEDFFEKYRTYNDRVFQYNLEDELIPAIINMFMICLLNPKQEPMRVRIDSCEQEIRSLGLGHLIPELYSALREIEGEKLQFVSENLLKTIK